MDIVTWFGQMMGLGVMFMCGYLMCKMSRGNSRKHTSANSTQEPELKPNQDLLDLANFLNKNPKRYKYIAHPEGTHMLIDPDSDHLVVLDLED